MLRSQAVMCMMAGDKVRHRSFLEGEYFYVDDGWLKDENGDKLDWEEFANLPESVWSNGWSIYGKKMSLIARIVDWTLDSETNLIMTLIAMILLAAAIVIGCIN